MADASSCDTVVVFASLSDTNISASLKWLSQRARKALYIFFAGALLFECPFYFLALQMICRGHLHYIHAAWLEILLYDHATTGHLPSKHLQRAMFSYCTFQAFDTSQAMTNV